MTHSASSIHVPRLCLLVIIIIALKYKINKSYILFHSCASRCLFEYVPSIRGEGGVRELVPKVRTLVEWPALKSRVCTHINDFCISVQSVALINFPFARES